MAEGGSGTQLLPWVQHQPWERAGQSRAAAAPHPPQTLPALARVPCTHARGAGHSEKHSPITAEPVQPDCSRVCGYGKIPINNATSLLFVLT